MAHAIRRPIRLKGAAQHKYRAKPQTVDGHRFPSQAEARRYCELKALLSAGCIRCLRLQPRYALLPWRWPEQPRPLAHYVADFEYERRVLIGTGETWTWTRVVEDVKGMRTPMYRLKRKWFEAQYGVLVTEVTYR